MVKHTVFGVERDIDILREVFPSEIEINRMESYLQGCEHGWFDSVHNSTKLHYRKFLPKATPKPEAIIIWMHGVQTHSGRAYIDDEGRKFNMAILSETCVEQGWALYAHDMIGHGYSEGDRMYLPNYEVVRDDYIAFIQLVVSMHDIDTPIFLVGESFGGCMSLIVAKYFQEHPEVMPKGFHGILLLAPALYIPAVAPVGIVGLKYFLQPLLGPSCRFPTFFPNPVSPEFLWRDPKLLYLYAKEKRAAEMLFEPSYRHANFGTSLTLLKCVKYARDTTMLGFKLPVAVLHGTGDRATPKEGSSEYFLQRISTPKKNFVYKQIDGGYHDLLADPATDEVMQFMCDWVRNRMAHPDGCTSSSPQGDLDKSRICDYNSNSVAIMNSIMNSVRNKFVWLIFQRDFMSVLVIFVTSLLLKS